MASASGPDSATGGRRRIWRAGLAAVATGLAGPPVGAMVLMIGVSMISAWDGASLMSALHDVAMGPVVGLLAAPFAFMIGGIPAAIAAVLVGVWVYWRGTMGYLAAIAIALIACGVFVAAASFDDPAARDPTGFARTTSIGWYLGGLSAATAVVLRWIFGRLGLVN